MAKKNDMRAVCMSYGRPMNDHSPNCEDANAPQVIDWNDPLAMKQVEHKRPVDVIQDLLMSRNDLMPEEISALRSAVYVISRLTTADSSEKGIVDIAGKVERAIAWELGIWSPKGK